MKLEKYSPSDRLKPFIRTFLVIESEAGMQSNILPDTFMAMAFRCSGSVSYADNGMQHLLPEAVITGLRKSARHMTYAKQSATLLVMFKEGGAAAFIHTPLHQLFGMSLSLEHFIPRRQLLDIEEQLAEAPNNAARIILIERFLLSLLKETQPDFLVLNALQKINTSHGTVRINVLARELNISQDPFEKRFRRMVGTSPKQYSSIVRLKNVIASYRQNKNLTAAAYDAGYFDQAHFIKDFKSFTGQTPLNFFKSSSYW